MSDTQTVRQTIIDAMQRRGFSETELARSLGCSRTAVFHWTRGRNGPSIAMRHKLARLLNMSIDDFARHHETSSP